jgi:hypothetical protein
MATVFVAVQPTTSTYYLHSLGGTGTPAASYPVTILEADVGTIEVAEELDGSWVGTDTPVSTEWTARTLVKFRPGKSEYPIDDNPTADAILEEALRMHRATDPISRGQARWTIADGQAADVTLSEPT